MSIITGVTIPHISDFIDLFIFKFLPIFFISSLLIKIIKHRLFGPKRFKYGSNFLYALVSPMLPALWFVSYLVVDSYGRFTILGNRVFIGLILTIALLFALISFVLLKLVDKYLLLKRKKIIILILMLISFGFLYPKRLYSVNSYESYFIVSNCQCLGLGVGRICYGVPFACKQKRQSNTYKINDENIKIKNLIE